MQALFALTFVLVFAFSMARLCCSMKKVGLGANKKIFALNIAIMTMFGLSEGLNSYVTISKKQLFHYLTMVSLYLFSNFIAACLISMVMVKVGWTGFGTLVSKRDGET
jgi:hypothetical protein